MQHGAFRVGPGQRTSSPPSLPRSQSNMSASVSMPNLPAHPKRLLWPSADLSPMVGCACLLVAGDFQDIFMRLVAERVLSPAMKGATFLKGEVGFKKIAPQPPPRAGCTWHVYCSPFNPGGAEVMHELANAVGMRLQVTAEATNLAKCESMLCYLTSLTWTSGDRSALFADEVHQAMDQGVRILLAHEMPGVGGQEARHAVAFSTFFACEHGATPVELLRKGIYSTIAVPLKGNASRRASYVLLSDALAEVPPPRKAVVEGGSRATMGRATTRMSRGSAMAAGRGTMRTSRSSAIAAARSSRMDARDSNASCNSSRGPMAASSASTSRCSELGPVETSQPSEGSTDVNRPMPAESAGGGLISSRMGSLERAGSKSTLVAASAKLSEKSSDFRIKARRKRSHLIDTVELEHLEEDGSATARAPRRLLDPAMLVRRTKSGASTSRRRGSVDAPATHRRRGCCDAPPTSRQRSVDTAVRVPSRTPPPDPSSALCAALQRVSAVQEFELSEEQQDRQRASWRISGRQDSPYELQAVPLPPPCRLLPPTSWITQQEQVLAFANLCSACAHPTGLLTDSPHAQTLTPSKQAADEGEHSVRAAGSALTPASAACSSAATARHSWHTNATGPPIAKAAISQRRLSLPSASADVRARI